MVWDWNPDQVNILGHSLKLGTISQHGVNSLRILFKLFKYFLDVRTFECDAVMLLTKPLLESTHIKEMSNLNVKGKSGQFDVTL